MTLISFTLNSFMIYFYSWQFNYGLWFILYSNKTMLVWKLFAVYFKISLFFFMFIVQYLNQHKGHSRWSGYFQC